MELLFAGRLFAACAVIALVLASFALAVRAPGRLRFGGRSGGKLLSLVETTYLPNASSLHVICVAGSYYVIGRSAAHIATLCEIEPEAVTRWSGGATPHVPAHWLWDIVARLRRRAHAA